MLGHLVIYFARGLTPKEISERLFISEVTTVTYKRNLRVKLKIGLTTELIQFAQAFDLV
ncbi:MAG: hypothetical protein EOO53_20480 [Gammaproteobacteria bacterium]|nr:MAG: hypothetical protein EOO53_20480 [Gammaproteobacteria bacterium]